MLHTVKLRCEALLEENIYHVLRTCFNAESESFEFGSAHLLKEGCRYRLKVQKRGCDHFLNALARQYDHRGL